MQKVTVDPLQKRLDLAALVLVVGDAAESVGDCEHAMSAPEGLPVRKRRVEVGVTGEVPLP